MNPTPQPLRSARATPAVTLHWVIALLLVGALKHLWVDKDGLFQRMWPW